MTVLRNRLWHYRRRCAARAISLAQARSVYFQILLLHHVLSSSHSAVGWGAREAIAGKFPRRMCVCTNRRGKIRFCENPATRQEKPPQILSITNQDTTPTHAHAHRTRDIRIGLSTLIHWSITTHGGGNNSSDRPGRGSTPEEKTEEPPRTRGRAQQVQIRVWKSMPQKLTRRPGRGKTTAVLLCTSDAPVPLCDEKNPVSQICRSGLWPACLCLFRSNTTFLCFFHRACSGARRWVHSRVERLRERG